jgi:hypothetical protein
MEVQQLPSIMAARKVVVVIPMMSPRKTEQAHAALQSRTRTLNLRERRVIIMCDGKRTLDELRTLFGTDTDATIFRLCAQGFLHIGEQQAPPPAPTAAPAPAPVAVNPRRSLVAAKMYMINMLELQRHEEALSHRLWLQASRDADEVVAHLLSAMHFLQSHTNASMGKRIREQLGDVLPEEYLPALHTSLSMSRIHARLQSRAIVAVSLKLASENSSSTPPNTLDNHVDGVAHPALVALA